MKELAPGVFQLRGFPPNAINCYVIGDVLVDAATRRARRRVFSQNDVAATEGGPEHISSLQRPGHGPPWRDTAAFVAFAENLPTP